MSVMSMLSPRQNLCVCTRKWGFTLLELLTVIAVIAIIAAILIPVVSNVRREALSTTCASNLRQIGSASQMYANEFGGILPADSVGDSWLCWWHELAYYFLDVSRDVQARTITRGGEEIPYNFSELTTPEGNRIGVGASERRVPIYSSPAARARHASIGDWSTNNYYIRVYAMNQQLANPEGARVASVDEPARTMLFMNARRGNAEYYHRIANTSHALPQGPRTGDHDFIHPGDSINAVFVDGHVRNITAEDLPRDSDDPFWNPRPR